MPGSLLEIALATRDIRASWDFYQSLGFGSALTGDLLDHPYGVVTCGPLHLGLHGDRRPSPSLVFTGPELAMRAARFSAAGIELTLRRLDPDEFNQIAFDEPTGTQIRLLEARSYSPPASTPAATALGTFDTFSLVAQGFAEVAQFWQRLGYQTAEDEAPWPRLRVLGLGLSLGYHLPRLHDEPLLLFRGEATAAAQRLDALGLRAGRGLGRAAPAGSLLVRSPEDLCLALLA